MEILIVSPYEYALQRQAEKLRERLFCKDIDDYRLHIVYALPADLDGKISGKQYDLAYVDSHYTAEEVGKVRDYLSGRKIIERF